MTQAAALAPQLSLLGGFELTCGTEVLAPCTSGQRLLAYLAVHSRARPVRRTALAERLWCDVAPQRAASSLRSVLWRLPRPQGRPLVTSTAATLRLAPEVQVDLWAGEVQARAISSAAAVARPGASAPTDEADRAGAGNDIGGLDRTDELAALSTLSGDLLPDWCEDWLLVEQESYRQARLHALEQLCASLRGAGRYHAALQAGLAAVQCEPLRESAHRRVIEVHLAEGNHGEALRQYQGFRRLLADELGLPPSGAIRRLVGPLLGRPVEDSGAADRSGPTARPGDQPGRA